MKRIVAIAFAVLVWVGSIQAAPPLAVETFQAAWEIIRDTHFDTNYNGVDWNAARTKYLPRVEKAKSNEEVREIIQEMLDQLGISHLMILPGSAPSGKPGAVSEAKPTAKPAIDHSGNGTIGIEVRALNATNIVVFRVEAGSSAEGAGVRPGWIIDSIDGEPALDATVASTGLGRHQRDFLLWHHASELLRGRVGEDCEIVCDTGAGKKTLQIAHHPEAGEVARLGNLPPMFTRVSTNGFKTANGKRVGYIRFNLWMIPAIMPIDRFIDEYRNADGIVFDLRGNVGGIGGMAMGTAGQLVNERASLGKMKMRDNELSFNLFPRTVDTRRNPTNTFQGKIAILIDPITLSSAELFAGGLQELKRARLFGERTGGQALPAVSDRLPNGDLLYHAVADFTTPKGRRLEENGVEPDEHIPLRLEALRAGKDEPLAAALKWIENSSR
jgi:carboxyl-terminal processing protease